MSSDDRKRLLAAKHRAADRLIKLLLEDDLPPGHQQATYSFGQANKVPKVPGPPRSMANVPVRTDGGRIPKDRQKADDLFSTLETLMRNVGIKSSIHAGNDGDYLQLKKWEEVHLQSGIENVNQFANAVLKSQLGDGFPGIEGLYAYSAAQVLLPRTDFSQSAGETDWLFHSYCYGGSPSRLEAFYMYGSHEVNSMAKSIACAFEISTPVTATVRPQKDGTCQVHLSGGDKHGDVLAYIDDYFKGMFESPGAKMWGIRVEGNVVHVTRRPDEGQSSRSSDQSSGQTSNSLTGQTEEVPANPTTP